MGDHAGMWIISIVEEYEESTAVAVVADEATARALVEKTQALRTDPFDGTRFTVEPVVVLTDPDDVSELISAGEDACLSFAPMEDGHV